ncbi:hypothetical protein EUZ85_17060 [Hahella sp. KA22]|uniref:hypothetical protein n=1 Tax=Hahella sp. KA22 TaxID=1628392 RepID=UPI000FDD8CC8|nr:hypothetical protein [Hahella sp. KA22]AZZ92342.1 hypothetical protein ENC22_14485 [Hahella sp. KA22]QAY55715.1 hypothetical protein EUZ85_17060 [Hahella sp. KA22]
MKVLYTLIHDTNKYLRPAFDSSQIIEVLGETTHENIKYRIDIRVAPISFKRVIETPLRMSFPKDGKEQKSCDIPDVAVMQGRLFLSAKAYGVLSPVIGQDGEFLPATYELGEGYIFIPMRVADDVDAVDTEHCTKNDWGYFSHLSFHEARLEGWSVFRTKLNGYQSLYCQDYVKKAIEDARLSGLYITSDLANIYPEEQATQN